MLQYPRDFFVWVDETGAAQVWVCCLYTTFYTWEKDICSGHLNSGSNNGEKFVDFKLNTSHSYQSLSHSCVCVCVCVRVCVHVPVCAPCACMCVCVCVPRVCVCGYRITAQSTAQSTYHHTALTTTPLRSCLVT